MLLHQGKYVISRIKLFIISILFGSLGIDRMYIADYKKGLLKFITLGGLGIWYIIDLFHIGIGKKIGNEPYYWTCEINKPNTCNHETNLIINGLFYFALASLIIVVFFYPRNINANEIMKKDYKIHNEDRLQSTGQYHNDNNQD